jgi:hypothetical protein
MKLSNLINALKELDNQCYGDPDVDMECNGWSMELTDGKLEGVCDISFVRGELSQSPVWKETLTLYFDIIPE